MSRSLLGRLLVTSAAASAALALTACVDGVAANIAPAPTPLPSPPPAQSPAIFPNITTSTNFATLGLEAPSIPNSSASASTLLRDNFSVKFDAANNSYFIQLPSHGGALISTSEDSTWWYGHLEGSFQGEFANIFKPSAINPSIQLSYTSFGNSNIYGFCDYYTRCTKLDFYAFGSATPASGIPLSGSATYGAYVAGSALDSNATVGGSATLSFDFAAGSLAGHFDPILNGANPTTGAPTTTNLGTYSFVNTVYGAGKADFSGQLSVSGASSTGAFDGQFTGPVAQELMARWTAPYLNPNTQQWAQMFGVWVGKKR